MFSKSDRLKSDKAGYVIALIGLVFIGCAFFTVSSQTRRDATQDYQKNGVEISSRFGQELTPVERSRVVSKVLTHPLISGRIKGHKVRAIRVTHERGGVTEEQTNQSHLALVTLFDYTTGRATRYTLNADTGDLLKEEALRGRPQSSQEEIAEATRIIERDAELSSLVQAGGKLIGGFIVDAPDGRSTTHRYMQMRLVSGDLSQTKRVVIIDLSDGVLAAQD